MLSKRSRSSLQRRGACESSTPNDASKGNAVPVPKPHQFIQKSSNNEKNQCSSVFASGASIVQVRLDVWFGEGGGTEAWVG
jgi:hypothetical protein